MLSFQIEAVEPSQNMVTLALLPRIDFSRPRGSLKNSQVVSLISLLILE